jgi:hypothetical protein
MGLAFAKHYKKLASYAFRNVNSSDRTKRTFHLLSIRQRYEAARSNIVKEKINLFLKK